MAKTKRTTTKTSKKSSLASFTSYRPTKKVAIFLIVAGLLILLSIRKDLYLAAMVNGSPITNAEVLSRINKAYRTQMLNQMINEKIIMDEARKNKIIVTQSDINKKISEIETSVGGAQALDSMLAQQNQTRDSLKEQLLVQLTVEKMYATQSAVSADEVNKFITENKTALSATDSAGQEKEAKDTLVQQKLGDVFRTKFQELKNQAKVQIF